ncbi:MAG TPA: DUF3168 domain-containing protein [Ktedonobacteraceae bacterium]|jgi:hypothetical protein|nr:DUF3168 domain-containing protein [Ktedonobacteraceae bacterium]
MTQTAAGEIEKAVGDILAPAGVTDTVLSSLGIVGVFDVRGVEDNQPFDYITIGDTLERPNNTLGRRGYDNSFTVHVWSRAFSTKKVQAIVSRINQLLDQVHLNLSTQAHVSTRYDQSMYLPQPDGLTLHAPIRYMFYSEE